MKEFAKDMASLTVQKILEEKIKIETQGKTPRVVLMSYETFEMIEKNWIESFKGLPWADTISYELEKRRNNQGKIFLGDGTLLGLWIVRVDTLESFKVY